MKKIIKNLIILTLSVMLTAASFAFSVSAVAKTTIAFSSNKPKANDSVTVTVTVNGSEAMYSTVFNVNYNAEVLRFESGDFASGDAGIVKVAGLPGGASKQSYSFRFTAIAAGSSMVKVSGTTYYYDAEDVVEASATMTVSDAAKSDNAQLKALSLSKGTLSPKFSASKTSYTASVANNVTECKVYATAADGNAKVEVAGDNALKVGKNIRTVTVTAASGAQKTYKITITRLDENESAPSDSDETASEPETEPESNPYEAVVDGAAYTVATDISGISLPNGFSATVGEYNGTEVAVAEDKSANYTVYYLKSAEGDSYAPYLLSEDGSAFEKLEYATFGDNTYIFADFPSDTTAPEGYYSVNTEIGGFNLKTYAAEAPEYADFCYVYCFFDGAYGVYRYDSRENVLQRAPEFKLVYADDNALPSDAGFTARFNSLSSNAKIIVIGLALAVIGAIALIVLLAVRLIRGRERFDDDFEDDDLFANGFDEVTVSDETEPETVDAENSEE